MYEDKYKNLHLTKSEDLNGFLNLIADLNEPLELFAIGGTAMVLKNIKESTKDIDFLTTEGYEKIKKTMGHPHLKVGVCKAPCFLDDPKSETVRLRPHSKECGFRFMDIKKLFSLAGLKEESSDKICNIWRLGKTRIDIFYGGFIMGISFPADWKRLSQKIKEIGKIKLYILNWYDLIITKISRSETRDIDDIIAIIHHEGLDINLLKKRYYSIAETALITDYDYKFKHLEREYAKRKTD